MAGKKTISTLTLSQPVNAHDIQLVLCLFANNTVKQCNERFSFSIVGKIKGVSCIDGQAKITANYNSKTNLTDDLEITQNQFIYSNQSTTAVILNMNLRLHGVLSWEGIVDIRFGLQLRYSSQKLTVYAVHSSYSIKTKSKSRLILMQ